MGEVVANVWGGWRMSEAGGEWHGREEVRGRDRGEWEVSALSCQALGPL